MHDEVRATGQVLVEFLNGADEVIERHEFQNKVVRSGREHIAALLAGDATAPMTFMALGGSPFATTDDMTALVSHMFRKAITSRTRSGTTTTFVCVFGPGEGSQYPAEIGIFNAASGGTMLARVSTTSLVEKAAASTFRVTWTISLV